MDNSEQKMMNSENIDSLVVESDQKNLEVILDIPLEITIELGRTRMVVNDLLKLAQGSVIELSKVAGETLEILANQRLVAKGEVVAVNDKYGIRLTEIVTPMERLESLK
ncbi:MAG: flagellar motor switch protein FliN [Desulfosarcina sp.]|nr:flagellar motor switch protein FliN [Desulfobacterales bacterium]